MNFTCFALIIFFIFHLTLCAQSNDFSGELENWEILPEGNGHVTLKSSAYIFSGKGSDKRRLQRTVSVDSGNRHYELRVELSFSFNQGSGFLLEIVELDDCGQTVSWSPKFYSYYAAIDQPDNAVFHRSWLLKAETREVRLIFSSPYLKPEEFVTIHRVLGRPVVK